MPGICDKMGESLGKLSITRNCLRGMVWICVSLVGSWGQTPTGQNGTVVIHLASAGYKPDVGCSYAGKDIPRDLTLLNDDDKLRLLFVNDALLVVYRSTCRQSSMVQGSDPRVWQMDAWFFDPKTGKLIGVDTWPTVKRRWVNDRWDTQARILGVDSGFVVHAGNSLSLYSLDRKKKASLPLEESRSWAVKVVPGGRELHLQGIYGDEARGEWLSTDTLALEHSKQEFAGVTSASSDAVVSQRAHCIRLDPMNGAPHDLYCPASRDLGIPVFVSDTAVLAVSGRSVVLLSGEGQKLWSREVHSGHHISSHNVSLSGNRFALALSGRTTFDGTLVPAHKQAVFVYDSEKRTLIFHSVVGREFELKDFALSPDGGALAVLKGDSIEIYTLHE